MKLLHFVNAGLWLANSVCWAFYAHVPLLAVASLVTALGTGWLGWTAED